MNTDIVPADSTAKAALAEAITDAQKAVLTQRTPPEHIKQRPGKGGKTFNYVEHAYVTRQLNLAFNWQWSWDILEWRMFPSEGMPAEVFVVGRLTIHTPAGDITKQQFGTSDVKTDKAGTPLSIGDDLKAASSDGLKKAASLLGLALDLYESDDMLPTRQPAQAEREFEALGRAVFGAQWQVKRDQAIMAKVKRDSLRSAADLTPADYRELSERLKAVQASRQESNGKQQPVPDTAGEAQAEAAP